MIFVDMECFKHNWLLVAIDPEKQETTVIWDDVARLERFYKERKRDIWVGFNIRNYDQWLIKGILNGYNPYAISEWIIEKKKKGHEFSSALYRVPLITFDCFVGYNGLKTLEAFMGKSVVETSVPFDIARPLTDDEKRMTEFYCISDVENTMEVFAQRFEEFTAQLALIKMFDMPIEYISKTKAQLTAIILGAKKVKRNDEFDIHFPDNLQMGRYQAVLDYFKNDWSYDKNFVFDVAGIPHVYATGGIHGAKGNVKKWNARKGCWELDASQQRAYCEDGEFLHIDVASYYPTLMVTYPEFCAPRNIPSVDKLREIIDTRLRYKAEENPLAAPLKIVVNGVYGCLKDKFSPLYDPRQSNHVCIWGQLFLTDLIDKLEDHCDIINSNTDGLIVKIRDNYDEIVSIVRKFEERTHLTFDIDRATKIVQRNVNNYACVMEDGKVKAKGSVLKLAKPLDNDLPIVGEAVRNHLLGIKSLTDTIMECDELRSFQKVYKLSSAYDYVVHNGEVHVNKCYRVFASRRVDDGILYKVKKGGNPQKFASCPDRCRIVNENIEGVTVPMWLDKRWYVEEAQKRLSAFTCVGDTTEE